MPEPIDVGSVLGGRYKVTGRILASAENDVILDGLDQTLNRPVSILVSAPENSANLAQSAREVATGERVSNVSILDLGNSDGSTYLIAARASASDLLDLVVPTEPTELSNDPVYEEPFFTDTLGTEIFGSARADAPESAAYVYEDNSPLTPASPSPAVLPPVQAAQPVKESPAVIPTAAAAAVPAPVQPIAQAAPAAPESPKVSLWSDDDYSFVNEDHAAAQDRAPVAFPAEARAEYDSYEPEEGEYDDDDENAPRKSGRLLTGIIVSVLVVGALVFALSHIGTLFNGTPVADGTTTGAGNSSKPSASAGPNTSSAAPAVVAPAIAGITDITVYAPGVTRYDDIYLDRLKDAVDGNPATFWPTVEFSSPEFANFTDSIDLAVELKQESTVSSVTINQLKGSGGQFNILTNSKPSMDGAKKIGSGSFTGPDFTLKVADGQKAKYVIVSFTQLPTMSSYRTYPYALNIAEISIK